MNVPTHRIHASAEEAAGGLEAGFYRAAFENAADAMLISNDDRVYVESNAAACRLLGMARDELVGQRVDDLTPERRRNRLDARWREFLERGSQRAEYQLTCADGRTIDIEYSATANVAPGLHLAILRDVTAQKSTERTQRATGERLQRIIDSAPSAIWVKDADSHYELTNASFQRILSGPVETVIDQGLISAELLDQIRSGDRRVLEDLEPIEEEQQIPAADGTVRTFLTLKFPLKEPSGEIKLCGIATDITERKRWEQEVRVRADQQAAVAALGREALVADLDDLLKAAVSAVAASIECDLAGILELSPNKDHLGLVAAAGMLGEEDVGKVTVPAGSSSHAGYALLLGEPVTSEYASETRFEVTEVLRRAGMKCGAVVPVAGGLDQHGVLAVHRRTERAFSDGDVYFLQSVGTVVAAAFAREKAYRLQRDLQTAERLESVGQLAGGIAHDFNNMLAVIINYAQFALDGLEPGSALYEDIGEVKRTAERGAELTRQLLMFSRKDLHGVEVLSINEVIEGLDCLLRRTLGEHVDLRLRLDPNAPQVSLNAGQLERVIVNLAVNARDAMPRGGTLTIETRVAQLSEPLMTASGEISAGNYLRLTVSDTGSGMPSEVIERAFEPFFTTKDRSQGTGLGLAIVYGVITAAGGHTAIYSEPGTGTTVRIYLPSAVPSEPSADLEPAPPPSGACRRVLLVEDDPALRKLAARILGSGDYRVQTASSGADALLALAEGSAPVDLVLTDVVMPEMSGRDLAERVRDIRPDAALLFMSGYPDDVLARHQLQLGDIPLLEKPFTSEELLTAVNSVLGVNDAAMADDALLAEEEA